MGYVCSFFIGGLVIMGEIVLWLVYRFLPWKDYPLAFYLPWWPLFLGAVNAGCAAFWQKVLNKSAMERSRFLAASLIIGFSICTFMVLGGYRKFKTLGQYLFYFAFVVSVYVFLYQTMVYYLEYLFCGYWSPQHWDKIITPGVPFLGTQNVKNKNIT